MTQPALEQRYKDGEYLQSNPDWHTEDSAWKAAHIGQILRKNQVNFKTGTEVGCGAGLILQELATAMPDHKWQGYDISPDAGTFWKRYPEGRVEYFNEDFLAAGQKTDLLMLIDVFEHVPDYIGFLEKLRPLSTYFVFHIPLDMNVLGVVRDRQITARNKVGHLHYFSKATAIATLEDAGYSIQDWFYTHVSQREGISFGPQTHLANLVRKPMYALMPDMAVKVMGGYSLMVLAKGGA